jgi:hypothetical protein
MAAKTVAAGSLDAFLCKCNAQQQTLTATSGLLRFLDCLIFFMPKIVLLWCRGLNYISSNTIQKFAVMSRTERGRE